MQTHLIPITILSGLSHQQKACFIEQMLQQMPNSFAIINLDSQHETFFKNTIPSSIFHSLNDENHLHECIHSVAALPTTKAILLILSAEHKVSEITEQLIEETIPNTTLSINALISLIDTETFLKDFQSEDHLNDRGLSHALNDLSIAEQLIDYIEYADFLLYPKTSTIDLEKYHHIQDILRYLNPQAHLIETNLYLISYSNLLHSSSFNVEKTMNGAKWMHLLTHQNPQPSSSQIKHFVYRARRPFHPKLFWNLLHQDWSEIIRCKGFFWLASRPNWTGTLSQIGKICRIDTAGQWWACIPQDEWPEDEAFQKEIKKDWFGQIEQTEIGDRRQEIVLIGFNLDEEKWQKLFDQCLIDENTLEKNHTFVDPFPEWVLEDHEDDH